MSPVRELDGTAVVDVCGVWGNEVELVTGYGVEKCV